MVSPGPQEIAARTSARYTRLDDWLRWQETLHPKSIDLGLARCAEVWRRLQSGPPAFPLISVAGTNGKGSSVAMLESIFREAGYRVGCYTSPHLLRYNERVQLDGRPVDDQALCEAFARIDAARGDVPLTYFEFGTLAAMLIFLDADLDLAVMEIGLGGRLDAVNLFDPDLALITHIDIDHGVAGRRPGIHRLREGGHPARARARGVRRPLTARQPAAGRR